MTITNTDHPEVTLDQSEGRFIHNDPIKHAEPAFLHTVDGSNYRCLGCGTEFKRKDIVHKKAMAT